MINDDILVKFSIDRIKSKDSPITLEWVDYAKTLSKQIRWIRDNDFMSIGVDDLTLKRYIPGEIKIGQRIILSDYLDANCGTLVGTNATILGRVCRVNGDAIELEIEGIGCGTDQERDPNRTLSWGTLIYPNMKNYPTYLEMVSKPRPDGGNVYYFYNKFFRDNRYNYIEGDHKLTKKLILSSLRNICTRYLSDTRERKRYFPYFNRIKTEINRTSPDVTLKKIKNIIKSGDIMSDRGLILICKKILWILKKEGEELKDTKEILPNKE